MATLGMVHVDDEGFTRGLTPFAACVFRKHEGFYFAERHLPRFLDTCAWAGLATQKIPSTLELCEMVRRAIDEKEYTDSLVKIYATRGRRSLANSSEDPVVIVDVQPRPYPPIAVALEVIEWMRLYPDRKLTGAYAEPMRKIEETKTHGCDDLLYTDRANLITESTTANIFFVTPEGELMTPGGNILSGVTRDTALALAKKSGIFRSVDEQAAVNVKLLPRFSEAFVTSTTRGITPVHRIVAGDCYSLAVSPETFTAKLQALYYEFQENYFRERGV